MAVIHLHPRELCLENIIYYVMVYTLHRSTFSAGGHPQCVCLFILKYKNK